VNPEFGVRVIVSLTQVALRVEDVAIEPIGKPVAAAAGVGKHREGAPGVASGVGDEGQPERAA
jgi:hypothetical protein